MKKMTTPAATKLGGSSLRIDETTPHLRDEFDSQDAHDAFVAWLGPRLGTYRVHERLRELHGAESRMDELARARGAIAAVGALQQYLGNSHPITTKVLGTISLRSGEDRNQWYALKERLESDLSVLDAFLSILRNDLKKPGGAGRPRMASRNALLSDCTFQLRKQGLTLTAARAKAARILDLCHVAIPDSGRTIRSLTRKSPSPRR